MEQLSIIDPHMAALQDQTIRDTVSRERGRLLDFIRRRVARPEDAEDILQDVFFQLVQNYRGLVTIDHVTSWLFKVARNKIIDMYRKKKPESMPVLGREEGDEPLSLADLLPDLGIGPDELYGNSLLMDALEEALAELPAEQRDVFMLNELDGKSFKEISEATGVSINTLLSRKRYAVLHLRDRLQGFYNELESGW